MNMVYCGSEHKHGPQYLLLSTVIVMFILLPPGSSTTANYFGLTFHFSLLLSFCLRLFLSL